MGKHIIPQYYLKGFSDPTNTSLIWVYEKGNNRVFSSSVKSIANENNIWPEQTEKSLENKIEHPANLVLKKIRNHLPIIQRDKDALSAYMVVMLIRVPRGLQRIKERSPTVMSEIFEKTETEIHRLIKEHPEKEEILQKRLIELPLIKTEWGINFPMEVWYKILTAEYMPKVKIALSQMKWMVLTSENRHAFITSDNPVFFFEGEGIGKPESQVFFPISSKICLYLNWNNKVKDGYFNVKEIAVKEINKRIASATTKYIYYSKSDQGIIALINKKDWKFKRII